MTGWLCFFSALTLFMATDLFPWNFLEAHTLIGRSLAQIQFPHRFLNFANLFLCLLLGTLLCQLFRESHANMKKAVNFVIGLNLIFLIFFLSNYATGNPAQKKYEYEALDRFATSAHYLPVGASMDRYAYDGKVHGEGFERAEMLSRTTHTARFSVKTSEGGTLTLPILNYPGYHAVDSSGTEYPIQNGYNSQISLDLPAGFDGELTVAFKDPVYWTAAIYVSLCSAILLCGILLKNNRKRKNA